MAENFKCHNWPTNIKLHFLVANIASKAYTKGSHTPEALTLQENIQLF
jgi:hypothetical protein